MTADMATYQALITQDVTSFQYLYLSNRHDVQKYK